MPVSGALTAKALARATKRKRVLALLLIEIAELLLSNSMDALDDKTLPDM